MSFLILLLMHKLFSPVTGLLPTTGWLLIYVRALKTEGQQQEWSHSLGRWIKPGPFRCEEEAGQKLSEVVWEAPLCCLRSSDWCLCMRVVWQKSGHKCLCFLYYSAGCLPDSPCIVGLMDGNWVVVWYGPLLSGTISVAGLGGSWI